VKRGDNAIVVAGTPLQSFNDVRGNREGGAAKLAPSSYRSNVGKLSMKADAP
jgi:hypothetical protein